jgi:hypothetical protein|tara:strand:- start:625 stop:1956 length:1332 start_codon:yes stop_codon:yes gene_type:complete
MGSKKMVQRPLSFQKKKKNEEQNTRTRSDEVDTTGVEVITIDDSSTTSDDPKRTEDSASSPSGGQNVDSVKTPSATMGLRKEEEDTNKKPVEEEKKGGGKRKKGGVGAKTKTREELVVVSSSDSAEKKGAERGKKAKADDSGYNDDDVHDDGDIKIFIPKMNLGVARSKSGVSKTPARRVALAVEPKKTKKAPAKKAPAKKATKTSTKASKKNVPWSGPETKALMDVRLEVLTDCLVDSNFVANRIQNRVDSKAARKKALEARYTNEFGMKDGYRAMKKDIIIPYVLGEIELQELKDKLEFESDEDVATFVEQIQLEFALNVLQCDIVDDAGEVEKDKVSARKYGKFNHRKEKDRKKAATEFLVDRKAELAASNEGEKEESDISWFKSIPAKKGKDKRDRFFKDIIGQDYGDAKRGTPALKKKNSNFDHWNNKCSLLAELESE